MTVVPVLVEVTSSDVAGARRCCAPFYKHAAGVTSFSCSGVCFRDTGRRDSAAATTALRVLVPASLLLPFSSTSPSSSSSPEAHQQLDPATSIRVTFTLLANSAARASKSPPASARTAVLAPAHTAGLRVRSSNARQLHTLPARLVRIVEVAEQSSLLAQLPERLSFASGKEWRAGWALRSDAPPPSAEAAAELAARYSRAHGRFALLEVQCSDAEEVDLLPASAWAASASPRADAVLVSAGCSLLAIGSPFGCLAPYHFANSVYGAGVSNVLSADGRSATAGGSSSAAKSTCAAASAPALARVNDAAAPAATAAAEVAAAVGDQSVLLLDGVLMPGMEGGLLVLPASSTSGSSAAPCHGADETSCSPSGGQAVAIVVAPLSRPSDGLQLHLALPLMPLLRAAMRSVPGAHASHGAGAAHSNGCFRAVAAAPAAAAAAAVQEEAAACCSRHRCSPLAEALNAVVMVRARGQWASGVLVSRIGHVITNAHLFAPTSRSGSSSGTAAGTACKDVTTSASETAAMVHTTANSPQQGGHGGGGGGGGGTSEGGQTEPCSVRIVVPGGGGGFRWCAAQRLSGVGAVGSHLDLALLRLADAECVRHVQPAALPPPAELDAQLQPGLRVAVAGNGLFGPSLGWSPSLTFGHVTNVVRLPSGRPTMLLTSAAVHSGASGGAVLDAASGRLVGLVTSNARHAGGQTLPHLNFCIAAHELRPLIASLTTAAGAPGVPGAVPRGPRRSESPRTSSPLPAAEQSAPGDCGSGHGSEEAAKSSARVWALLPPAAAAGTGKPPGLPQPPPTPAPGPVAAADVVAATDIPAAAALLSWPARL